MLLQRGRKIPVVIAYGHPWLLLDAAAAVTYAAQGVKNNFIFYCHLTEVEIRRLHRRFGHSAAARFYNLLQRAGYEVNFEELQRLTRHCEHCQLHSRKPGRFKFTLKDDMEFNHTIYIDLFWLSDGPVLYIIDAATSF